jgi:hypothetical protein
MPKPFPRPAALLETVAAPLKLSSKIRSRKMAVARRTPGEREGDFSTRRIQVSQLPWFKRPEQLWD